MRFQKGESGNPNGRPKGSNNKAKADLQSKVLQIIENNFDRLQEDIENLEPAERVKSITNLLSYVLPKQQSVSIEAQLEAEYKHLAILLENAPDECIEAITEKILSLHEMSKQNAVDVSSILKPKEPKYLEHNPFYDNEKE